jgi:hypothetical protein
MPLQFLREFFFLQAGYGGSTWASENVTVCLGAGDLSDSILFISSRDPSWTILDAMPKCIQSIGCKVELFPRR